MKGHLRWIVPLLSAPLSFFMCTLLIAGVVSAMDAGSIGDTPGALLLLILIAAAFITPVILLVMAIRQGKRVYHERRRAKGRLTPDEQQEVDNRLQNELQSERAWQHSRMIRQELLSGNPLRPIRVWDVVPYEGEEFYFDVPISYARYYGTNVTYTQNSGFYFGSPAFVVAGLAADAIGNAHARSKAEAQAREQWREFQTTRLVISNKRLLCQFPGRWMSFDYSDITAVYPEVAQWTLICNFVNWEPLMLRGPASPLAAVVTLERVHGASALIEHPSMAPMGIADMRMTKSDTIDGGADPTKIIKP